METADLEDDIESMELRPSRFDWVYSTQPRIHEGAKGEGGVNPVYTVTNPISVVWGWGEGADF